MGRPEPSVLFSQTFVHSQLDEHVDEVLFSEPIVITACEFLEQNASSASQVVPLAGATSPPSFALEIFVQCEGETRFRRLCQPFLYSHSSANLLEVEAIVTNHLVVRGSYRSLSLVIYGNTAEDLGQFNIEFDDSSLTNLVTSAEGKLEDLPLALHSTSQGIEESIAPLNALALPADASDLSIEVKKFLQLISKMLELPQLEDSLDKVLSAVVRAVCTYVSCDLSCEAIKQNCPQDTYEFKDIKTVHDAIIEATKELVEVLECNSRDGVNDLLADCTFLNNEADLVSSKQLVDMLSMLFCFDHSSRILQHKNILLGLSVAFLLSSGRESCFHFVNCGGMGHLVRVFSHDTLDSSAVILLSLGVLEQATRHPIGCEGILGWWPHQEEVIPSGINKVYGPLLKLFLKRPRHDVASLTSYVLCRLRFYEVATRYEYVVLSVLENESAAGRVTSTTSNTLNVAKSELKKLLKLVSTSGPVDDSSTVACARRSLILGQTEGLSSYKATNTLITSSSCCFSSWDIDSNLFILLNDRGFLPLSAALLSSPQLRSKAGDSVDTFVDIASTISEILLLLLMCRSGLLFLSSQPELAATLIDALRGTSDMNKEECVPLRYASVLLSKGFVCSPREVATIVETHLRMLNVIDRLLISTPHSEEFLWVLWELCGLSRSYCGRQALLVLGYFPEAISLLIEALHSTKEAEPVDNNIGASPVNLAIFHSAAEIFEIIVTDATASSLNSWIGHVMELHKALHSSSPGSNRKDAPTRLLEWIDAGVVYHKNGVVGLLRYSAVLASGGDAHFNASSILVTDMADVDNLIGDASGGTDINVLENLGKIIFEKTFDGVTLRDSSVAQLTTAIRILAFISENSTVAVSLYDEGAITVICSIVINCSFMLERSSSTYDYLVDEGTECNSTSDLLLERYREQSLVDLLIPSLLLLVNLFQNLKEVNDQHRNTKLLNTLLRLHREVSPKLAACSSDLSSPYPDSALGFGAVCHLVVSALSFWPVHGWAPGLFNSLLANVPGTSLLALGPKEACSVLCLLNDLFPNEGIWLWKNGMPLLSAVRSLAIATLLGPQKEREINWYLEASHQEKLLTQLTPHLNKIVQIFQQYTVSALVVIQDMLQVFITRLACQKAESACLLLRPILSCIHKHVFDTAALSEIDAYKVYGYLDFIANLAEHPHAKALLLEESVVQMLTVVLERCFNALEAEGTQISGSITSPKNGYNVISWCIPTFKCLLHLLHSQKSSSQAKRHDSSVNLSTKDCWLILQYLLKFCQVLPIGEELLYCLATFKELGFCNEGRNAFLTACNVNASTKELESGKVNEDNGDYTLEALEWRKHPLLLCWKRLLKAVHYKDAFSARAVDLLSSGTLCFCVDGKSLNSNAVDAMKLLFGFCDDTVGDESSAEDLACVKEMIMLLDSRGSSDDNLATRNASESAKSLLLIFQKPRGSVSLDDVSCGKDVSSSRDYDLILSTMGDANAEKTNDTLYMGALGEKFLWECPEPDRLSQTQPAKRRLPSLDGTVKRVKVESVVGEVTGQNSYSRGAGPSAASSGPTRRDTFRQRKPNTSRPPSMHVDDYVARERSIDGSTNPNVIAVPRVGPSGGRPPSIHVDEFMARERERQNLAVPVVGQPSPQVTNITEPSNVDKEKVNKPKQLKTDLDDDLQEIDIVFDGEESESDDKLPFPQPDDNLPQQASVIVEQSSHSVVEETESDVNETSQFPHFGTPNVDENTQRDFSSVSVSRPEIPLIREASVSSDNKFFDQFDESRNLISIKSSIGRESITAGNFPGSIYSNVASAQIQVDSRMTSQKQYLNNSPQNTVGSRGTYNQPPLPPMPPPSTLSTLPTQTPDRAPSHSLPFGNSLTEFQPPFSTSFQVHSEYMSPFSSSPASIASSLPMPDPKYARNSVSSPGSLPPLPPTPPPFSSGQYNLPPVKASILQSSPYNGVSELPQNSAVGTRLGSLSTSNPGLPYVPPPLMPPLNFNRPANFPATIYGSTSNPQQGDFSIPQSSMQSMHQLQPLQPPLQRPAQPPQHIWPPLQSSQQLEQPAPLQSPVQLHQLQMLQQPQNSPRHLNYQAQHPEGSQSRHQQQVEYSQSQVQSQQGDSASQRQQDLSLQEYFRDPKAITALLGNKEELCRLLEQHPKLMQMLQERLGQQ